MAAHYNELDELVVTIRQWGHELGFSHTAIAPIDLGPTEQRLEQWLAKGHHGEMDYMARHGTKRSRPAELLPGTQSVVCVRLDYLPQESHSPLHRLEQPDHAYLSRYALGRDYHKLMRQRLARLAARIEARVGPCQSRAFVDSAPVMEKPLGALAGLGWMGKHTNLLSRTGSWFFLGELFLDLALPPDSPEQNHCGHCSRCLDICPTRAIIAPYQLDARLCISYLTIEHPGPIPLELRPLLGNRIYGCDDCQLVCPWNRFARPSTEADFAPRHGLDQATLIDLFSWDESTFLRRLEGSPIRRIGHERWLRNLATALGNAPPTEARELALRSRLHHPSALVREHVQWALGQTSGQT